MKFYVLQDANGTAVDCQLTIQKCRDAAEAQALHAYEIMLVDCDVSAETIRKMLAQNGGYANDTRTVRSTLKLPEAVSDGDRFENYNDDASNQFRQQYRHTR